MKNAIDCAELRATFPVTPALIDVRRRPAFEESARIVAGATWRDHLRAAEWAYQFSRAPEVVVYCVHGQQVSQAAAAVLRAHGLQARYLQGGFDAWESAGGATAARAPLIAQQEKAWVAPENPCPDYIACVWLLRRFIGPRAVVHFVEEDWLAEIAAEIGAVSFAEMINRGAGNESAENMFDGFIRHFDLRDSALPKLSEIVRGAAEESAGLSALLDGLRELHLQDDARVEAAMGFYDALYRHCAV